MAFGIWHSVFGIWNLDFIFGIRYSVLDSDPGLDLDLDSELYSDFDLDYDIFGLDSITRIGFAFRFGFGIGFRFEFRI